MHRSLPFVAIEKHLTGLKHVVTLGVKTNFSDYAEDDQRRMQEADKIYYPSLFYAHLFHAMGKKIFPGVNTYLYAGDKIKQTALFALMQIPHPRTRFFYGQRQKQNISAYFPFPFIAKIPRGSAMGRGVYLIHNREELDAYCEKTHVAYIQEYFPIKRDLRIVVIGKKVVLAYWRVAPTTDFRTNISGGGAICMEGVPVAAVDLALGTALRCGWDDVGIDIIAYKDRFYVVEANMKFGRQGFAAAGMDYKKMMERMMQKGEI